MFRRNLPIFVVFGAALAIGVGAIIAALATSDDAEAPTSTISQFEASQAAKIAYFDSDQTVASADCNAIEWVAETDVWSVRCTLARDDGSTEVTDWRVTPDGVARPVGDGAGT